MKFLDLNAFITLNEAKKMKINPMMLSRLVANEALLRVEHGVYARDLDWLTDSLKKYIVPCTLYPKAVVCGISALTYYNLTDAEERQVWIALPALKIIHNPRYRIIRPSGIAYTLGVEKYSFGKRVVRIYDIEKTIVDAFKYSTEEVAIKALKGYLKRKDKNVRKLCNYSRQLRKPLDEIVTALLADE
ncbi:MAG: hypothetical protein A2W61_08570 [Deltaproteobacteria bacterium RIFCSPLOWO2_01_44_7]|nr:MAG: hypothetical protein A2712_09725 [Deltaproteobacteria bacterium RIFCSPHIGHO2_01_FULL_43_49]OGQ15391.1 MAG: hypothetical protein A3D22_10255 [Deltaproteobacteria bacterium RIFCSPHIGHO2_02_FULL_44_53]OGQ29585.1 MAG: hypothetical protein A3D98_10455 [Deltaproteobacteria bacterium RIFCSPHIGHO2_12_FULL_44_21]OGQ32198.1 MAG: hypothetical protein A2979_00100 [Deltaproteobacteria bacterium RIFCSPLOWO2_01_FULL_45_74]OGQ43839.1 MAG: hypothetical protein A3I70_03995 [Deltaproteobacteria bacterium 